MATTHWLNLLTLIQHPLVNDLRIIIIFSSSKSCKSREFSGSVGWGWKVRLVDKTQSMFKLHHPPLLDAFRSSTWWRIYQSCCCIVASFFRNQRKQFTNQFTNSINNNINLFIRKWADNIMIIVTDNWVNTGLFMATFRQHMYMPAHYFDFFN